MRQGFVLTQHVFFLFPFYSISQFAYVRARLDVLHGPDASTHVGAYSNSHNPADRGRYIDEPSPLMHHTPAT